MVQSFNDATNAATTGDKSAIRALQAWQYLIGKAANRQIARYEDLQRLMGYPDVRPLIPAIGCIMYFCEQNELPALTVIAVGKGGTPGAGFSAVPPEDRDRERERVFEFEWNAIVPPSIEQFREAGQRGRQSSLSAGQNSEEALAQAS